MDPRVQNSPPAPGNPAGDRRWYVAGCRTNEAPEQVGTHAAASPGGKGTSMGRGARRSARSLGTSHHLVCNIPARTAL